MNKNAFFLGLLGCLAILPACAVGTGDPTASSAQAVVLDVRCATDAECPAGFECETEIEHGTDASYCVSHESEHTSTGDCPAGYEREIEHSQIFCKPHGGADGVGSGAGTAGDACATSADCAAGLECEIEVEHGVTTAACVAHGGG